MKQRSLTNARIVRVVEDGEPPEFKTLFKVWEKPLLPGQMRAQNTNKIGEREILFCLNFPPFQ